MFSLYVYGTHFPLKKGNSLEVYGRSAPWSIRPGSIRPTFLVDPPRRIWGAEGPRKWGGSTTEVYAVVPPHSDESTCERSRGFHHHYSLTQAMPTVAPGLPRYQTNLWTRPNSQSHRRIICHWSGLTASASRIQVVRKGLYVHYCW